MSCLRPSLLLSATAFALINPTAGALAQDGKTTRLETLVAEDDAPGLTEGYVQTWTSTGSKTQAPLSEIPQSISVVTRDQMEDRGVTDVGEALSYSAGVLSQPFGTDSRFISPIIRGFDATNNVFLDGFRFGRSFGAISFEPYGLEEIDVLRGPSSVLYGNAAPGGIVNLVSKHPTFNDFGEAGVSYGTYDRKELTFDLGGVAQDVFSYRLTGLARKSDAQQDTLKDDRLYIAPALTWQPDADTSFTILTHLQYDEAGSPFGLPQAGTLDPNPFGRVPRHRYLGEPDFDQSESTFASIGYEFRHRFNDTWEVRQNAQYLHLDFDYQNLYFSSLGTDLRTVNRGASIQTEDYGQFAIDNQLEGTFSTGVFEHDLLLGLDYRRIDDDRTSTFDYSVAPIDLENPVYGQDIIIDDPKTTVTDAVANRTGLYVQDQIRYKKALLSLALRHDWSNIDYRNENGEDQDDRAFTGRAGLTYLFDNGLAPYVSYSTSFDPQIGTTTSGKTYKPSEGEQYEIGLKFQPQGMRSFFTVSLFDLTRSNVTTTRAQEDNNGDFQSVTEQTGEINVRGIELEAHASLTNGLGLIGSYTYNDAEITEGDDTVSGGSLVASTTGNRPSQVPEHMASLWLNYAFQPGTKLEGLSMGGGMRYVGERYGDDANTIELPSATVFDAALRYRNDRFNASLTVSNIADEEYVASCNFGCFYGEGRTVSGKVGITW